jgi:hypothetical protein
VGLLFLAKKFTGGKENVRWCVVVMQQPVLLSSKLGAKSSHQTGSGAHPAFYPMGTVTFPGDRAEEVCS